MMMIAVTRPCCYNTNVGNVGPVKKCIVVDGKIGILTLIIVELETGTNFAAVSVNPLLAVVMMKTRQR